MYNTVYTALPVIGISIFNQDLNDHWSLQYPQLYGPGQKNVLFNKKLFLNCALHSGFSSLLLFFIPWAAMQDTVRGDGKDIADYQSFVMLGQTCLLLVVSLQLCLDTNYWTAVNQFFVWGTLAVYFAVTFTMDTKDIYFIMTSGFPFIGSARNSLNQPNVWLTILLTTSLCILPVVATRFTFLLLCPTVTDKVRHKTREEALLVPPPRRSHPKRYSTRRSSYAFSHSQGYGDLVTSQKFFRAKRSRPALFAQDQSALAQNQPQTYSTIPE